MKTRREVVLEALHATVLEWTQGPPTRSGDVDLMNRLDAALDVGMGDVPPLPDKGMPRDAIRAHVERWAQAMAHEIRKTIPDGYGFMFSTFTFGDDGWSTYVSNAKREDMIKFLVEMAVTLERRGMSPPVGRSS